jgi:DNA-binding IclR family transcriptional regulator
LTIVPALAQILHCLTKYGQRLDSDLAKETGVPIAKVRQRVAELAAQSTVTLLPRGRQMRPTTGWLMAARSKYGAVISRSRGGRHDPQ